MFDTLTHIHTYEFAHACTHIHVYECIQEHIVHTPGYIKINGNIVEIIAAVSYNSLRLHLTDIFNSNHNV